MIFKLKEGRRTIKDYNQAEKVISPYETLNHYYDNGEDLISTFWRMVLKNTGDYLHRDDLQKKLREVYPKRASELAEVADRWNSYADREKAEMNILADMVAEGRIPAAARKKLTDYREAFARAGVSMVYLWRRCHRSGRCWRVKKERAMKNSRENYRKAMNRR